LISPESFVNLHTHSTYSTLDGFSSVSEYISRAVEVGQTALGITDHGNMHGIYELITGCQKAGITPVPGCEFYVAPLNPDGAKVQSPIYYGEPGAEGDVSGRGNYLHLTMWAVNDEGLRNMFELQMLAASPKHKRAGYPRIDLDMMREHSAGVVVSTGCPSGEISTRFRLGQDDAAYRYAETLISIYGKDNVFVEVMNHNMSSDLERELLVKQIKLAEALGLRLLATNDCHYAHHSDAPHHEEMLAIGTGSTMNDLPKEQGGRRFCFDGDQYFLKTAEQMLELFPEDAYPGAVVNTSVLAAKVEGFSLFEYRSDLRPIPHIPADETEESYLRRVVTSLAYEQFHDDEVKYRAVLERAAKELDVLASANYCGYMLIVAEYVNWFRDSFSVRNSAGDIVMSAVGIARGSAGGSIVAYLLGITDIDPIEYGLFFERFISAGRVDQAELLAGDGISVVVPVSEKVKVLTEDGSEVEKYVHQVIEGDWVLVEPDTPVGRVFSESIVVED
jgi:DNA polymerase-3 subunit alpha